MQNIYLIPKHIYCPKCNVKISFGFMMSIIDKGIQCVECDYIFTKEYFGKYFGKIENVVE